MGLTEAWISNVHNSVFPTAPGVVANPIHPAAYSFKNFQFSEIYDQFLKVMNLIRKVREPNAEEVQFIITVSPVPLTATASNMHVLSASSYSKSVLRAVAGDLANNFSNIDYFPSYEMITNPAARGFFYNPNLRTVRAQGVETVMKIFFNEHKPFVTLKDDVSNGHSIALDNEMKIACEDELLDAFIK